MDIDKLIQYLFIVTCFVTITCGGLYIAKYFKQSICVCTN
jgi:hypothetical protein